jgi:hypothetical protein
VLVGIAVGWSELGQLLEGSLDEGLLVDGVLLGISLEGTLLVLLQFLMLL